MTTRTRSSSLGHRFVASEAFARARSVAMGPSGAAIPEQRVVGLSTRELCEALRLRTYTDLLAFEIDGTPVPALLPEPARVPQLVTTVPVDHVQLELGPELSENVTAGGALDGAPLPEAAFTFGSAPTLTPVPRFGLAWPVSKATLDEPGIVEQLLDRRLNLGFTVGLERQIIAGVVGDPNGAGILNVDPPNVTKGGSDVYRLDTVARAVQTVQDAGWGIATPLSVVGSPTTLEAIRTEKSAGSEELYAFREHVVPDVDVWVPSLAVPAGVVVVGDFAGGAMLFLKGPLEVSVATAHSDFLVRSMVEMKIECRAYSWIGQPSAFCVAEGL